LSDAGRARKTVNLPRTLDRRHEAVITVRDITEPTEPMLVNGRGTLTVQSPPGLQ